MEALRWNMLVKNVLDAAEEHQLWVPGDRIVVAVSGGPDSVAFLHIMHEISKRHVPLELICAHVHHGFRSESDDEAEKMMELAQQLGITFEWTKADVPSYMELTGQGPQEDRNKRYAFFTKWLPNIMRQASLWHIMRMIRRRRSCFICSAEAACRAFQE